MTIVIAIAAVMLFGFACLAVWNVMSGFDLEPRSAQRQEDRPVQVTADNRPADDCVLCGQQLRTAATSDEVVSEIERQIGDETARVLQLLRRPVPENIQRLYLQ